MFPLFPTLFLWFSTPREQGDKWSLGVATGDHLPRGSRSRDGRLLLPHLPRDARIPEASGGLWSELGLKHPEEGDQLQQDALLHLRQVFRTAAGDPDGNVLASYESSKLCKFISMRDKKLPVVKLKIIY